MAAPPLHEFDADLASRFEPTAASSKIAVLLEIAEADSITVIEAPFGRQELRGPFYVVAEGDRSYGAARQEFEQTHRPVGRNRWLKIAPVLAYRAAGTWRVETHIAATHETTVVARPGDWIVKQATGEVMVLEPEGFSERYQPAEGC